MGKRRAPAQEQDISRDRQKPPSGNRPIEHSEAPPAVAGPANGGFWKTESGKRIFQLAKDFEAVLDECAVDAGVKSVHRVRTGSRRLQALVETMLREAGPSGQTLNKPAKAWLRQMRKIRRAAAPLRDLDVHRKLLKRVLEPSAKGGPHGSPAHADADTQIELFRIEPFPAGPLRCQALALDKWLRQKRRGHAERALKKQIRKRREKLRERQADFFLAVEDGLARGLKFPRMEAVLALEDFVRVVEAMPSLGSDNLHEFRKRIKKVRYVAEGAEKAQSAQIVAGALRRMQDAIGDWHDWQCLAEESKTVIGQEESELPVWLKNQADRALTVALGASERIRGRLLREWAAGPNQPASAESKLQKKQPARVLGPQPARKPAAPGAA